MTSKTALADRIKRTLSPAARRRLRLCALLLPLLAVFIMSGCQSAGYYTRAAHGQYQIWARQQCIYRLAADPATDPELRERLERVIEIRNFAEHELGLPPTRHYLRYADLERPYVVWNVYAAPEFSTDSKKWWYPFVGSLKYRGYFSETEARRHADGLRRKGYDVYVSGIRAYSTLGWFADPVLNTFIHTADEDLAELIFHELAHQRLFVRGDTDFNEAFATAVAEEGLRRWMKASEDPRAYARYQADMKRHREMVRLVLAARATLEQLYAESPQGKARPDEIEGARRAKQEVFDRLQASYQQLKVSWDGYAGYDSWFANSLNNAKLNTVATYYELVPAFQALLRAQDGDLSRFYSEVAKIGSLPLDERHQQVASWLEEMPALIAQEEGETLPPRPGAANQTVPGTSGTL